MKGEKSGSGFQRGFLLGKPKKKTRKSSKQTTSSGVSAQEDSTRASAVQIPRDEKDSKDAPHDRPGTTSTALLNLEADSAFKTKPESTRPLLRVVNDDSPKTDTAVSAPKSLLSVLMDDSKAQEDSQIE